MNHLVPLDPVQWLPAAALSLSSLWHKNMGKQGLGCTITKLSFNITKINCALCLVSSILWPIYELLWLNPQWPLGAADWRWQSGDVDHHGGEQRRGSLWDRAPHTDTTRGWLYWSKAQGGGKQTHTNTHVSEISVLMFGRILKIDM